MGFAKGNPGYNDRRGLSALERFKSFCRFEPETGCVVWIGGTTAGRGHSVRYPSFWFQGRRVFGHRWAAEYIHEIDITGMHVDHCCPHIPIPNTLCVQHLQAKTLLQNVDLQHQRRRNFIHLQVGLLQYADLYGHDPDPLPLKDAVPFYDPPAWLGPIKGHDDADDCPF